MEYQNYEDYMRSVLGYNPVPNNIYADTYNRPNEYLYDMPYDTNYINQNADYLNDFYPETYRMIYPMICKVCNQYDNTQITNDMLENMVDEVYRNFEPEDNPTETRTELKNGDVRNPNAKQEVRKETRQQNFLLKDLIKILFIRELLKRRRRPPMRPPRPGRPPLGGFGPQFNF